MRASTTWHKHHLKNTMAEIAALPSQHPARREYFADVVAKTRWELWHSDNHNSKYNGRSAVWGRLLHLRIDSLSQDNDRDWLEFMVCN